MHDSDARGTVIIVDTIKVSPRESRGRSKPTRLLFMSANRNFLDHVNPRIVTCTIKRPICSLSHSFVASKSSESIAKLILSVTGLEKLLDNYYITKMRERSSNPPNILESFGFN